MKNTTFLLFLMAFLPLCAMKPGENPGGDDLQSTISITVTELSDGTKVVRMMLPGALQEELGEQGITPDHLAQLARVAPEVLAVFQAPFKLLEQKGQEPKKTSSESDE